MNIHTFSNYSRTRGNPYAPPAKALGQIEFTFGSLSMPVTAGPFRASVTYPHHFKVKLAKEIKMDCNVSVPIEDFSTPDPDQMLVGLSHALDAARRGQPVYAGCMGGIGRTGLFLALLAKLEFAYAVERFGAMPYARYEVGAVAHVRARYLRHAVETKAQQEFVDAFDVTPLMGALDEYNGIPARGLVGALLNLRSTVRGLLHTLVPGLYPRRHGRRHGRRPA